MKPFSERIKSFPADQFIDWLCLACVDVRQVRTEEDAQDEINNIRDAVTERLSALEARVKAAEDAADKYLHEAKRHQRALLAAEAELARLKTCKPKCSNRTVAESRPSVLPEKMPPTVWQVLYDECGGFVDCTPEPQKIWDAFRKFAGGEIAE